MFQVHTPGEDDGLIRVHAIGNGFVFGHIGITGEECGTFECVLRGKFPHPPFVDVIHQVETPRHGKEWTRASENGDKSTGLDRTRMDEVRLEVP